MFRDEAQASPFPQAGLPEFERGKAASLKGDVSFKTVLQRTNAKKERNNKMSNSIMSRRSGQKIFQYLYLVLLLLLATCAGSAQKEEQRVRNIVLVHGAW